MMLMVQSGGDPTPNGPKPNMASQMFVLGGSLDIGKLAREHYSTVFRFCAMRVGADRAADASQETFITAQRAVRNYRGESKPLTWLLGIAHNECRRLVRQHKLEVEIPEFAPAPSRGESEGALVDKEVLRQALAALSQEHRDVILLHEIEGLTYDEIAVVVGVPVGTVKSRLHHAFQHLRRFVFPDQFAVSAVGEVR